MVRRSTASAPRTLPLIAILMVGAFVAATSVAAVSPGLSAAPGPAQGDAEALVAALADAPVNDRDASYLITVARSAVNLSGDPSDQPNRLRAQQMRNLEAAAAIEEVEDSVFPSDFARRIAAAEAASHWLQGTLSIPFDAARDHTTQPSTAPSAALLRLARHHGVEPTPAQTASLTELDDAPADISMVLTRFVDTFMTLELAADRAYASARLVQPLPENARGLDVQPSSPFTAANVDLAEVLPARNEFLSAANDLHAVLDAATTAHGGDCTPLHVPPVFTLELAGCDTTHTEDVVLVLDAGGNDTYLNNAGGNGVGGVAGTGCLSLARVGALVDLHGDDTYGDRTAPRRCGANGGGYIGLGILIDGDGDDQYTAGDYGTNGGGNYAGIGLLVDTGGADTFEGGSHGVNGGGSQGAGMLLIGPGTTRYVADTSGVNGGAATGTGFLHDVDGDDEYLATCCGANGGAYTGAAAFLLDGGGSDLFRAPAVIVGGVILFMPLGAVNGGATTAGSGFLLSLGGNDRYVGRHAGANGGGFLGGFGMLLDGTGDDIYSATDRGTNGGGHLGTGILIDMSGNDMYLATTDGANGGAATGFGLVLDGGGADYYEDAKVPGGACDDCSVPAKGQLGNQLDIVTATG